MPLVRLFSLVGSYSEPSPMWASGLPQCSLIALVQVLESVRVVLVSLMVTVPLPAGTVIVPCVSDHPEDVIVVL